MNFIKFNYTNEGNTIYKILILFEKSNTLKFASRRNKLAIIWCIKRRGRALHSRLARCDFSLNHSVHAAYMKHQNEDMCVVYNCFYYIVHRCEAPCRQKFRYQSNKDRDVLDKTMAHSLLLAQKMAKWLLSAFQTSFRR